MNRHSIILTTALAFGTVVAQAGVINITQGSTSGYTMTDGNTYVITKSVSFSNSTAGGNGMTVADGATVVIYIPTNVTLTATGANSNGQIGGGAGIFVPSSATLVVTGEGTLSARGGNAGNGGNGENGAKGYDSSADQGTYGGTGGRGGTGGGGSGSGIGGHGGTGGTGGSGGTGNLCYCWGWNKKGGNGGTGTKGGNGYDMGTVILLGTLTTDLISGQAGQGGNAGNYAECVEGSRYYSYPAGGGGGGGGGGAGAAAQSIGGGGASGGGGGGGGGGCAYDTPSTGPSATNAHGGGGNGGKSLVESGMAGEAKGVYYPNYSGNDPIGQGGNGGAGGSSGSAGANGTLLIANTVSLVTQRSFSYVNTDIAAQYSIRFDCGMAPSLPTISSNQVIGTLGVALPWPVPAVSCDKAVFDGWYSEQEGGVMYYDSKGLPVLSCYPIPSSQTLYAHWRIPDIVENLSFDSGCEYLWQTTLDESLLGGYELCSAAIPDGTNSWIKTVLTGPGKLSFDWKVSCENRYAYLQVLIDGVQQKRITGDKDWAALLYEIEAGEHDVVWNYVKDGAAAVGDDAGFVRNISWRPYLAFSSVSAHGTALPADNDALLYGDAVEASVDASVTDGDIRYDCIGWRGTGSAPAEGVSNTCAFVLREDSSLAWLWRTNYWTTLTVEGPATADFSEAWLEAGSVCTVAVAPSVPYYAIALSGDTAGVTLDGTNVVIVAGGPRELTVSMRELTLAGALGTIDLAWRTGGGSVWFPEAQVSADGLDAAQSGALDAKGTAWIETTVIGPGTLSFKWRFTPGSANSGVDLLVDGDYEDGLTDATDGWEDCSVEIGAGRHVVRWEFYGSDGANGTAWLDQVAWDGDYPTATYTTEVPVPYVWLDANAKPFVSRFWGDYEAAAFEIAANGVNKVWECYIAGLDPTDADAEFRAVISFANGAPVISWDPKLDAEEEAKRTYTIYGRESLTEGSWGPTNANSRFFKVSVELP